MPVDELGRGARQFVEIVGDRLGADDDVAGLPNFAFVTDVPVTCARKTSREAVFNDPKLPV